MSVTTWAHMEREQIRALRKNPEWIALMEEIWPMSKTLELIEAMRRERWEARRLIRLHRGRAKLRYTRLKKDQAAKLIMQRLGCTIRKLAAPFPFHRGESVFEESEREQR